MVVIEGSENHHVKVSRETDPKRILLDYDSNVIFSTPSSLSH